MPFIGVITNQKNENYVRENLGKIFKGENIICINEKNMFNVKNILFEAILLDRIIKNKTQLEKIISKSKYLVVNTDIEDAADMMKNTNLTVITYGFNNKSTFAVSSIEEKSIIICLQRSIFDKNGLEIEPQEFKMENRKNVDKYAIIGSEIIKIIYDTNRHKNNKI